MKPEPPIPTNKLIICPRDRVRAIRASFLVEQTNAYCSPKTKGGLVLPQGDDADLVEKKYSIGKVVDAGPECVTIKKGDIVVFAKAAAWRVPNGFEDATLFKMEESPGAVVCVLDPPSEEEMAEFDRIFKEEAQKHDDAVHGRGEFEADPDKKDEEPESRKRRHTTRYDKDGKAIDGDAQS